MTNVSRMPSKPCAAKAPPINVICCSVSAQDTISHCVAVVEFLSAYTTADLCDVPNGQTVRFGHNLVFNALLEALRYAEWQAGNEWRDALQLRRAEAGQSATGEA